MTCPEVVSRLDDLIDGALPPDQAARVRDHIDHCDSCRREFELAGKVKDLLGSSITPDPGADYFKESESMILARTVQSGAQVDYGHRTVSDTAGPSRRTALVRALLSVAASLAILFAAIYIGTSDDAQRVRVGDSTSPMLATADVRQLVSANASSVITPDDQLRIAQGMMLIGSPGLLGRFSVFPEMVRTKPSDES